MHMAPAPLYLPEIARTDGLQLFARALDGSTLSFQPPASAPVSVLLAAEGETRQPFAWAASPQHSLASSSFATL